MKKEIPLISTILIFAFLSGCRTPEKKYHYYPSSVELPNTSREMKTAGFWISKSTEPDKIILSGKEIDSFNLSIETELKVISDVLKLPRVYNGVSVRKELIGTFKNISKRKYHFDSGARPDKKFFIKILNLMNLTEIPDEISSRYGFIIRFSDQRLLPAATGLYSKKGIADFDVLQNSAMDIGTPVLLLHESFDGKWYYIRTSLSSGWVAATDVVLCDYEDLASYCGKVDFAVVISPKADIYENLAMTEHYGYARMGVKLPLSGYDKKQDIVSVLIPASAAEYKFFTKKCYIKRNDVNFGYLAYTKRNMLEQAFKMLNSPYGWGGMYGEQDCSRFIQSVFACMGVNMPRNSYSQSLVGGIGKRFGSKSDIAEKLEFLEKEGRSGITTLYFPGHIMLFIGFVDGSPYAVHNIWAYTQRMGSGDIVKIINRVVVSDLFLGLETKRGSFIDRLSSIRIVSK